MDWWIKAIQCHAMNLLIPNRIRLNFYSNVYMLKYTISLSRPMRGIIRWKHSRNAYFTTPPVHKRPPTVEALFLPRAHVERHADPPSTNAMLNALRGDAPLKHPRAKMPNESSTPRNMLC